MKKKANRIPVFVSAVIMTGMGGYLITWSAFRGPLHELFPTWSESQASLPFALHNITVCIMMLTTGSILSKLSSRTVFGIGGIAILVGLGIYPFLPKESPGFALVLAIIGFAFVAALSAGLGVIASFDTFIPWFPDRPGLVSGILTFWCGVAPMFLGALVSFFIDSFGVLVAVGLLGLVLFVAIYATLYWAKPPGADIELPPPPKAIQDEITKDYTPGEILRTASFWCIFIFNVTVRSAGLIVSDLGGTIAQTMGIAAVVGLMFAPANGFACILGGWLMDRFRLEHVLLLVAVAVACGGGLMLVGSKTGASALIIVGIALVGFGFGGVTVTGVTGTRLLFGMKHYAKNLGLVSVSIGPATVAVIFTGKLNSGGNYTGSFILVAIFGLAAIISCLFMYGAEKKRRAKLAMKPF